MNDHDQPERLDLAAERKQLFVDAVYGCTIVMPRDWHHIGFDQTRELSKQLRAVAGTGRVHDRWMDS